MATSALTHRKSQASWGRETAAMSRADPLKLMGIFAHPDDESLGIGGTLAKYAADGVETSLITATRGERGWLGDPAANPGLRALGEIREQELRAAAAVLSIRHLEILDYVDGDLDQADPAEIVAKLVAILRRLQPHVVITFASDGGYGHPDHMAISHFTTAALVCAADPAYVDADGGTRGHRVAKLYHRLWTPEEGEVFRAAFGDIAMEVDGEQRRPIGWPEWMITTRIDTADWWRTCWEAIACHRSQLPAYDHLLALPESQHRALWGNQGYYRAFSLVNRGRAMEKDLFEGLRMAGRVSRGQ
jgi:LmbE family N-acetylglucosaminyl deacetylase